MMTNNNNFSHFCFLLKSNQNPFFGPIELAHERRDAKQFCVCVSGTAPLLSIFAHRLRRDAELIIALDCRLCRERKERSAAVQFADWRPYH